MVSKEDFMLCQSLKENEINDTHKGMVANIKFDGVRIIAVKKDNSVILLNRGGGIFNKNFEEVVDDLLKIDGDFILDGEVISKEDDFTKLMTRARVKNPEKLKQRVLDVPIKFMVFDMLMLKDNVIIKKTLKERLDVLNTFFNSIDKTTIPNIELAEYGDVMSLLQRAKDEKREGIIIKDYDGIYEGGKRSYFWLKVKFFKEAEFKAITYEVNNAGIKVSDDVGRSVQVSGEQHNEVRELIDRDGYVDIEIQYLTQSKDGNYRFPSYKRIVGKV